MLGATLQLGTLTYLWSNTSAGPCMADPLNCLPFIADPASDPFGRLVVFLGCFTLSMWLISLRTIPSHGSSDPSIVDRLWSINPWLYVWYVALSAPVFTSRLALMCLCSTIWGLRLTWNFWRKGGFSGGEDYRWQVVRKWFPGWRWEVFNLYFICMFQQMIVLAFVTPAVVAAQSQRPLQTLDIAAACLYLTLFLGETVADLQMFAFQTEKYRRKAAGEDAGPYSKGFIDTGLWAYSRHPNYFCEVSMWWAFYLFSVAATGDAVNWTVSGCVFLTGLFVPPGASLDVTEMLSSAKYPQYAEYQNRVSRFVPWFPSHAKQA
eukprot:TRINITY_DN1672_c0_g1_i1.p1 TRINITY_DN1672_c0_g1~~TRINITY_DN1672_c0_g1_i1.p1  ORF type:complete len:367 (+),score=84.74 TRINITY_DN1672_c0_g1_i1:142-1101(+)